jgi:hypothetical protein
MACIPLLGSGARGAAEPRQEVESRVERVDQRPAVRVVPVAIGSKRVEPYACPVAIRDRGERHAEQRTTSHGQA